MNKHTAFYFLTTILLLIFTSNLKQKNPKELFLTDEHLKTFQKFGAEFNNEDFTFIANIPPDQKGLIKKKISDQGGEFIDIDQLYKQSALVKFSGFNDENLYDFVSELKQLFSSLSLAGHSYTNAHLAGMTIKIQKIIFPLVFGTMFVLIMLIFRNISVSLYLFFSSLFGVGIGLTLIKLFFGYSTILTSLTPLIAFILTLASQMHVIFGLSVFKIKSEFLKHKFLPIVIMMVTTLFGFMGLYLSDLASIRQFGLVTTLTLLITWAFNLLLLSNFNLKLTSKMPTWNFSIKTLKNKYVGHTVLILLILTSLISLNKMPILVEAIYFFSPEHDIRKGQNEISSKIGGTVQLEVIISKKDNTFINFSDIFALYDFEKKINEYKFFSQNELIRQANLSYSGNFSIPDHEMAYLVLKSKISNSFLSTISSEKYYKISIIAPTMNSAEYSLFYEKINKTIKDLPTQFNFSYSGINYLILSSQTALVKTLLQSLIGSFLVIALVFAILNRNLQNIISFSLISLATIFGGLFFMYLFGFSLNISSIMTLSISIGLVDDSTIHLLYAKKHGETEEQIKNSCIVPMTISNSILIISFLILGLESFIPIREFALGLVTMVLMGLCLDLFILPMIQEKQKEK